MDYYSFFIKFQGRGIFYNGRQVYKNEAFELVRQRVCTIDEMLANENGFSVADKNGWKDGRLVKEKLFI